MKTLLVTAAIAMMSFILPMEAIPSSLGQSIREFEAILDSPLLPGAIAESEFIFEIERKTNNLEATTVHYIITTHVPTNNNGFTAELDAFPEMKKHHSSSHECCTRTNRYRARLELTPNPAIGPVIINVVSIEQISRHCCKSLEDVSSSD